MQTGFKNGGNDLGAIFGSLVVQDGAGTAKGTATVPDATTPLTLKEGSNITMTVTGNVVTINGAAGGGSSSVQLTGDVTATGVTGSNITTTLSNTGVTAGTYHKVTVDAKGRVTSGAAMAKADVTGVGPFTLTELGVTAADAVIAAAGGGSKLSIKFSYSGGSISAGSFTQADGSALPAGVSVSAVSGTSFTLNHNKGAAPKTVMFHGWNSGTDMTQVLPPNTTSAVVKTAGHDATGLISFNLTPAGVGADSNGSCRVEITF